MKAFILAGGFATRLWPLTEKRAKPLLPLAGKPLLTHIVEKIPRAIPITVSTNAAFAGGFEEWKKTMPGREITIVIEETTKDAEKLGTNGALAQWIRSQQIDDDLLLITGDNYLGFSIEEFIASARPDHALIAAYDIGDLAKASAFGTIIIKETDRLPLTAYRLSPVSGFEEKPSHPKTSLVSTGCYVLPRTFLPIVLSYADDHPDHIGGIFEEFLRQKKNIDCFRFTEPWFDIGSFESYLEATKALVSERIQKSDDAEILNTTCDGSVVLGKRSRVTGSVLRDAVIFDDCIIDNCVLERCIIDNGCRLQGIDLSGKMVRARTVLEQGM